MKYYTNSIPWPIKEEKYMGYNYTTERPYTLTDEGQKKCFKVLDKARELVAKAGCVRGDALMADLMGVSWENLAVIDRLVELKYLFDVPIVPMPLQQHRIFVLGNG